MTNQFVRRKANKNYRYEDNDEALVSLLDGSDNDDAGNEDGISLQPRRKRHIDFIEHEVKEGDTLSSLSLQYNCTTSQIKQLNSIHRDNEIFALRVVRIPVKPFSVVTERISTVQSAAAESANFGDIIDIRSKGHESSKLPIGVLVDTTVGRSSLDDSSSDIPVRNPLLTPLPVPIVSSPPLIDPDLEVAETNVSTQRNNSSSFLQCNGADCGIPWAMLFICTLALGFVVPLIYIFFWYENKTKSSDGTLHS